MSTLKRSQMQDEQPPFWDLMTSVERTTWCNPERALIARGRIARRFSQTPTGWERRFVPADEWAADTVPGHPPLELDGYIDRELDGYIDRALDGYIDRALDGYIDRALQASRPQPTDYSFPNRPVFPAGPLVFDDAALVVTKARPRDWGIGVAIALASLGLGMALGALLELAK